MTTRRLIPYLFVIIAFAVIYWVTMVVDNKYLYLGFGKDWPEVTNNNKIPLHREIFSFGLTAIVLLVNILEIITTKADRFLLRFAKSILTIILTYAVCAAIFLLLDVKTFNLFYSHRGTPANTEIMVTLFLSTCGLLFLEVVKKLFLLGFDKSLLKRYIPKWLWLEKKI